MGQFEIDTITIMDKAYIHHHLKPDYTLKDSISLETKDFLHHIQSGQLQNSTPGGLITFLHRGMGNRHLPVLWNGINIQSIINGSYDLGLIPTSLFESLSFYSVGSPTLQGNNGFAGAIDLQSHPFKKQETQVFSNMSTLQNYATGFTTNIHRRKFDFSGGAEMGIDKNIFQYQYNQQKLTRVPTDFKKINILLNVAYYISSFQTLSIDFWWQDAERNIPTSITADPTTQKQSDKNLRTRIAHSLVTKKHKLETAFSYMNEKLNFNTKAIDSRSNLEVYTFSTEWSELSAKSYFIGLKIRNDIASPNFYTSTKTRLTTQLSVAKKIKWDNILISNVSIRQDFVDNQNMPLSWTAHTTFKDLAFVVARNYNLPGFNDLYWPSGGNVNLKTEKSLQTELKSDIRISALKVKLSVYANLVNDWIQWIPESSGIWTPANQKKVLSRGGEIKIEKQYATSKWIIQPSIFYTFNKTTALKHYFDPELVGKQLLYVPIHKAGIDMLVRKKKQTWIASYQFTSQRFDTPDESKSLKPIHLLDLKYVFYHLKWKSQISIFNLLNRDYNIVRFFPMPGINAEVKISYTI